MEQVRRVEGFAVEPLLETGRGKDAVEAHRKIESIALREERIQVDNADLRERRSLHLLDERRQIEIAAVFPRRRQHSRDNRVFAAARLCIHAGERQQAGRGVRRPFREQLGILSNGFRWRRE